VRFVAPPTSSVLAAIQAELLTHSGYQLGRALAALHMLGKLQADGDAQAQAFLAHH
jgi:hypothetical protein